MDLQLHTKLIVVQGFILIMLASVTEQSIPTIVERDPEEWKCDPPCDNNLGMFCLLRQCISCGFCPQDPFDLDQTGHLDIYKPCIQNGFCPRVCSSYLNLGSYSLANETFCEEIKAPKVTTPQPTAEEVVITTTANSTTGVTSTKPEAGDTTAKNPVGKKNIYKNDSTMAAFVVLVIVSIVLAIGGLGCFLKLIRNQFKKKPGSSGCSPTDTEDTTDTDQLVSSYEPLEIQLSEQNRTATVKGLGRLKCNALQLCACLHNPDRPNQNWMDTQGKDEIQLPGLMIPHQVYTVKAGRVIGEEFECIAKGEFNTQDFSNVTLDEECSTTIGNIFTNVALRRSLQVELYHQDMFDLIVAVFKLKGDSYLVFRHRRDLETLYSETLVAQNDIVERSVHLLLEELAKRSEAKDFVRKIAKTQRDSETQRDSGWYCKKCLQILHRMCIGNPDETFVVTMPPEC